MIYFFLFQQINYNKIKNKKKPLRSNKIWFQICMEIPTDIHSLI